MATVSTVPKLTISLRDATFRYGLSRTSLTKLGKEYGAITRYKNKYLLYVDFMDKVLESKRNNEI